MYFIVYFVSLAILSLVVAAGVGTSLRSLLAWVAFVL